MSAQTCLRPPPWRRHDNNDRLRGISRRLRGRYRRRRGAGADAANDTRKSDRALEALNGVIEM
jgi:hypothetical protein